MSKGQKTFDRGKRLTLLGGALTSAGAYGGLGYAGARYVASGGRAGGRAARTVVNESVGSFLGRPVARLGGRIFGGKRAARVARFAKRRGVRRAAAAVVSLGRKTKVMKIAPKLMRYGGYVGAVGLGAQIYGISRGGRPWKSKVDSIV